MMCTKCPKHYVGKGWHCWSGNKDLGHCHNGNPDIDRRLYRSPSHTMTTERKLRKERRKNEKTDNEDKA